MMEKYLYQGQKEYQKLIIPLLESAFPSDERPATEYFFSSLKKKENNLFLYFDDEDFIGFAFITFFF